VKHRLLITILLAGAVIVLSIVGYRSVSQALSNARWMKATEQLREIWVIYQWAATEGPYPPHPAVLPAQQLVPPQTFLDPRGFEDSVFGVGDLDLTKLFQIPSEDVFTDVEQFCNAVAAAAEELSGFYRFGDFWFVRLRQPTNSEKIVFAWMIPGPQGVRTVLFDNGHSETLSGAAWWSTLQADALERDRLGLPPLEPPPP
jgi:hypothetical protein